MPVTPFHIVAGVLVKSAKPKYFSWTVFALANVLIDTEAVYYFFTTGIPQHKYFHTWIGATVILILCALLGKYLCQFWLWIWNNIFLNRRYFPYFQNFKSGTKIDSDAFFPFPDGLLVTISSGATAVIQPGGSVKDNKVIEAADEAGISMIFTDIRHFRH